jgi:hypothetical protein
MFSIAIPKDTKFNDQTIQGLFVSYMTPERKNELVGIFNKDHGTNTILNQNEKIDPQLTICYTDSQGQGRIVLNIDLWKLEWILDAQSVEEYHQLTGLSVGSFISYDLSQQEQKTQFDVLKFVVAFIVYTSVHATSIEFVQDIKMPGSDKNSTKTSINKVMHFKPQGSVRPHYRNLRDEGSIKDNGRIGCQDQGGFR